MPNKNPAMNRFILPALWLTWLVVQIDRNIMNIAINPIATEFNLDASQMGTVLSSFFIGYLIMQIPGGILSDKLGSKKIILAALLIWTFFTGLTGFVTTFITMIIVRLFFGIGQGLYPAAVAKAIAENIPQEQRSSVQTKIMTGSTLGAVFAPLIGAPLIMAVGWKVAFISITSLSVIALILIMIGTKSTTKSDAPTANQAAAPSVDASPMYKSTYMWKAAAIFFLSNMLAYGLLNWVPTYLMTVQKVDLKSVGGLTALPIFFNIIGLLVMSKYLFKMNNKGIKITLIIASLFMALSFYLMASATTIPVFLAVQTIFALAVSAPLAYCYGFTHHALKSELAGRGYAMITMAGTVAGFLSPLAIGNVIKAAGGNFSAAFIFMAVLSIVSALVSITLPKEHYQI